MNEPIDNKDMILKYLVNKMTPEERQSFEDELKSNQDLKNELKELSYIYTGIYIINSINKGHIDTETLIDYAENPSSFDKDNLDEMKSHLESCKECREEYELCRQTYTNSGIDPEDSFFEKISRVLFAPRLVFRPVYGILLLVLLTIPVYFITSILMTERAETITCYLKDNTRTVGVENKVIITSKTGIVRLEPKIQLIFDCIKCIYEYELYDSEGNLLLTKHNIQGQKPFVFEVPATYFGEGDYHLIAREFEDGVEQDSFEYYFNVEFD